MKSSVRITSILCILCASALSGSALDREAFTFTKYDLQVRIEPEQQRMGVRGRITLRNDSATPQKIAVLQVSSSLDWRSITIATKTPEFVLQPYTSDIDHTGALSEAIVTLPQEVPPHGTVDLEIGYEGVIPADTTRLTRIGTPEDAAKSSDWDQISANFSAVRGIGYVAWYPIAAESANLSDEDSLSEVLTRWKQREVGAQMNLLFKSTRNGTILFSGTRSGFVITAEEGVQKAAAFDMVCDAASVPAFVQADYSAIKGRGDSSVNYLPGKASAAQSYADALRTLDSAIVPGRHFLDLQVAQLPDPDASPFEAQNLLLIPFNPAVTESDRLTLIYAEVRQEEPSARSWISEGVAHLAQVLDIEQRRGHQAAMEDLDTHRTMLVHAEQQFQPAAASAVANAATAGAASSHSLIDSSDDLYLQTKAMSVWWMLRDMLGDAAIKKAISLYRPEQDKEPSYMQQLIAAETPRDLEWFFDDWVYRDRGLPDFKIESVYPSKTATGAYIVTVTVDNLGSAGAEVPVILKFGGTEEDVAKRLELHAKSKGTIRIEAPSRPVEVVVNDGSVPESDLSNNNFNLQTP